MKRVFFLRLAECASLAARCAADGPGCSMCPLLKGLILRAGCVALLASSIACASTQPPATSTPPPAELAVILYEASHSCQPQPASVNTADEPAPEPASELFVETVLLDVPVGTNISAANLSAIAQLPDVRLLGTPHIVGKAEQQTTAPMDQHLGALARPTLSQLSLVAKNAESNLHVLEFELGFSLPNADPAGTPELSRTSFVVQGRSDHVLLGSADSPGDPQRKIVAIIKVYPVRSQEDLRTHFECKMRLHQQALKQL